jgi:hypothetical protein
MGDRALNTGAGLRLTKRSVFFSASAASRLSIGYWQPGTLARLIHIWKARDRHLQQRRNGAVYHRNSGLAMGLF